MTENEISNLVIGAAMTVHSSPGPGLLESSYEECLFYELKLKGLLAERQKALPLVYKEIKMDAGYRVDLIVENKVILEIKAVIEVNEIFFAQVLTYLKLSGCKLGLLLNFNVKSMKDGIKRIVYHF